MKSIGGHEENLDAIVDSKTEDASKQTKQGRVLSKANENKIRDAVTAISDVVAMDIPRPAKATLREASAGLEQVLAALGTDEEPKRAEADLKEAVSAVIFQTSREQRGTLLKILGIIDGNEKREEAAREVRSLLGV